MVLSISFPCFETKQVMFFPYIIHFPIFQGSLDKNCISLCFFIAWYMGIHR